MIGMQLTQSHSQWLYLIVSVHRIFGTKLNSFLSVLSNRTVDRLAHVYHFMSVDTEPFNPNI